MLWNKAQGEEPQGSKCLSLNKGEGSLFSEVECETLVLFEAEGRHFHVDDWLEDLDLVWELDGEGVMRLSERKWS